MQPGMIAVGRARHTKRLTYQDRAPGDRGLIDGGHGPGAVANGARLFPLHADDKAGDIHEMHDRQMEGLGQVDKAGDFVRGIRRPAGAMKIRITRKHRHRPTVQAGQAGNHGPTPQLANLQK